MNCYGDFAHIYDELINSDIDYLKWSKVILKICDDFNVTKKRYLDLCCGTGNMTQNLASCFAEAWAVDLSYDMLTEADLKLRNNAFKVKMVCQDMAKLNLNRKFDLITCCLDSTNYILKEEDMIEYFKRVALHLEDNGIFIFDINSYYKLSNILGNNTYNYDDENVTYIWENSFKENVVDMYLTFFVREGDMYRKFIEEHMERAYTDKDIRLFIKQAGLKILKTIDNYEDKSIDDSTERIVYIVKIDD
ncbi:class I SAM-dependent methyltransferase [Clostridium fermenticellae]|uniref:Class I SAM-dependent methyltransferase n=1 Tax=Clostridium fermenticellae TaxID=2068654 RepID=A0A386H234_9CLOT|nr:class I SAM-dependent methyltransferase [Clostridium fermenticellae]AYD39771.1 class I SAM-dependent methyltransferase [Clostridium fermenticellae]